jgi:hypothetical protein
VTDLDPVTPGIQVIRGSSIPVKVNVTDDVQVRNVQFLVNGQVVSNDVSFPYDFSAVAAPATPGGTTMSIQVRATDTGGNDRLSNTLTFNLVPDTFPPTVVGTTPTAGQKVFFTPSVSVRFSEPLDTSLLNSTGVSLKFLGADGVPGGGDDVSVPVRSVEPRNLGRGVAIFPGADLDTGNYQLSLDPSIISDRAGNHLTAPFSLQFTVLPASDIKAASGFPSVPREPSANVGQAIGIHFPGADTGLRLVFSTIDGNGNTSTVQIAPAGIDPATQTAFFTVPANANTGEINTTHVGALNFAGFRDFDVTRGTVDLIGNGFFATFPGHGFVVDLDGSTSSAGKLESKTTFNLQPGDYQLSFDLAGPSQTSPNTVAVSLGNVFSETFSRNINDPFLTFTRTIHVASATSGKLIFDHSGPGDNFGLLLDNVKLTSLATGQALLNDDFEFTLPDGPLPLQIVPIVDSVDAFSLAQDGSSVVARLRGRGFVEDNSSIYTFGGVSVVDVSPGAGPNVFGQSVENDTADVTVPLSSAAFGPIVVTTPGGTSVPLSLTFSGIAGLDESRPGDHAHRRRVYHGDRLLRRVHRQQRHPDPPAAEPDAGECRRHAGDARGAGGLQRRLPLADPGVQCGAAAAGRAGADVGRRDQHELRGAAGAGLPGGQ